MFKLLVAATAVSAVKVDLKAKAGWALNSEVADDNKMAKPLQFHQKLLVCNAYDSDEGMVISKNNMHLRSNETLSPNSCKYVDGKIYNKDRVNFSMLKAGIEGTFEVDELPAADSVLLLIAQKRDAGKTDLMSFQSFAFPAADPNSNDAQVAFINTIPEADKSERIRMADARKSMVKEAAREEDVLFNRVYVIESGSYDVDIVGGKFYQAEKAKKIAEIEAEKKAEEEKKHPKPHVAPKAVAAVHQSKGKTVAKKAEAKTEEKKAVPAPVAAKKVEEKKDAKKVSLLQSNDAVLKNFHTSKKIELTLERGQDYVILQTGTAENPVLIAFPGEAQPTGFVGFFKSMYHKMFSWI